MEAFVSSYHVKISNAVYVELTLNGYEGAETFSTYIEKGRVSLVEISSFGGAERLPTKLDDGERETILAYFHGHGEFIVIDDKKGAQYLRNHKIPYVNALLVPRLLFFAKKMSAQTFQNASSFLKENGRYAQWVKEYAENCPLEALAQFLPV